MAVPSFVAYSTAEGTTSITLDYYSGHTSGHIAFVWVSCYEAGSSAISTPTGFTALTQIDQANGTHARLFWRRLDGGEGSSISITIDANSGAGATMVGISGAVTSGTPYEDYGSGSGASGTNMTAGGTTTTGTDRLLLRFYASEDDGGGSPPATWTERVDFVTTGAFPELYVDSKDKAASGTEASTNRTVANNFSWVTADLAVLPQTTTAYTLTVDKADLTSAGQNVTLTAIRTMPAANATLTLAGQAVTLTATHLPLAADKADLTIAGQDVTLNKGFTIAADKIDLTLAGQDVTLTAIRTMPADKIDLTLAGQDVNLLHGYLVSADVGTLTLAGQDVSFLFNHLVAADAGTLTLSGQVVLLTKTWLPLDAGVAELTLSGQDVSLTKGRLVTADAGTLTIGGQTVSFIGPRRFDIGEAYYLHGTAFGYALSGRASGYSLSGRA